MSSKSTDQPEAQSAQAESAQAENTQPRFCSSCGRTKPVLGGNLVRCANGAKRWKCADCLARSKAHRASRQAQESQESQPPQDQLQ